MSSLSLSQFHIDNPNERLGVTLTIALLLHAFLVFGVSFKMEVNAPLSNTLDIVLVQNKTEEDPDDARYLAQESQQGGGTSEQNLRPSSLVRAPFPDEKVQEVSTVAPPQEATKQTQQSLEQMTTEQHSLEQVQAQSHQEKRQVESDSGEDKQELKQDDTLAMLSLIQSAKTTLASAQSVVDKAQAQSQRPRHRFPRANARRDIYAGYMDTWRVRTESLGNERFRNLARQLNLSGDVILDVAIRHDGSLEEIKVLRSSGSPQLDDIAVRTARAAAPYDPFSKRMRKEADIVHIIRTWRYENSQLSSEATSESSTYIPES